MEEFHFTDLRSDMKKKKKLVILIKKKSETHFLLQLTVVHPS